MNKLFFFMLLIATSRVQADSTTLLNRLGTLFSIEFVVVFALFFAPAFVGLMSFRRKSRNKTKATKAA